MRKAEGGLALGHLAEPVLSLGVSTVLGCCYGVLIGRLLAVPSRPFNVVLKRLPPATATRSAPLCCGVPSRPHACLPVTFREVQVCSARCGLATPLMLPFMMLQHAQNLQLIHSLSLRTNLLRVYFFGVFLHFLLNKSSRSSSS
jgi:hypothetical protein